MGGKTSNQSKAKYNEKAYDRISLAVPKGKKAEIEASAEERKLSLNAWINEAINEKLRKQ